MESNFNEEAAHRLLEDIEKLQYLIAQKQRDVEMGEIQQDVKKVEDEIKKLEKLLQIKSLEKILVTFPQDPDGRYTAYTYVTGLSLIYLSGENPVLAKEIIGVYSKLYDEHKKGIADREKIGLPNALNVKMVEFFENEDAGPNAWFLIGLAHYINTAKDTSAIESAIKFGREIADYLVNLTLSTKLKGEDVLGLKLNSNTDAVSLENVISVISALKMFSEIDKEKANEYKRYIEGLEKLAGLSLVDSDGYYNFYRGYKIEGNELIPDKVFATDVALWLLLSEDKAFFEKYNINPQKLFKDTLKRSKVEIAPYGTLLDYMDEDGKAVRGTAKPEEIKKFTPIHLGSIEWSEFAVKVQGKWNFQNEDIKSTVNEMNQAIERVKAGRGYLPYFVKEETVYQEKIPIGHGWETPYSKSPDLTSTLWRVFAQDNPFTLQKEADYEKVDLGRFKSSNDHSLVPAQIQERLSIIEKDYYRLIEKVFVEKKEIDERTQLELFNLTVSFYHLAGSLLGLNVNLGGNISGGLEPGGIMGGFVTLGAIGNTLAGEGIASGVLPWLALIDGILSISKDLLDARGYKKMQEQGAVILEVKSIPPFGTWIKVLFSDGREDTIWKPGVIKSFKELFKGVLSDRDKVVLLSERMRFAYVEAVFQPKEGFRYFIERQGVKIILYRTDGKEKEVIAEQDNVFIEGTEEFLSQKLKINLKDKEVKRIDGIATIENARKYLELYFNPEIAFIAIHPVTQRLRGVSFNEAGFFVREPNGALIHPETGEIMEPSLALRLIDSAFKQGKNLLSFIFPISKIPLGGLIAGKVFGVAILFN